VQLPATATAERTGAGLEVKLIDGLVVRGEDVEKLAALVRALRS
jgi:hypothetical protein